MQKIILALCALALLILSCCSHFPRAVTGMAGRQCSTEPRVVACGQGLRGQDCEYVQEQVALINRAVFNPLYRFAGWLPCPYGSKCLEEAIEARILVVTAPPVAIRVSAFENTTLAVTAMRVDPTNGCIGPEAILVLVDAQDQSEAERVITLRHELLHAVGLPHNFWDKSGSQMTPGIHPTNDPGELDEMDLNALRAIYGRL